MSNQYLKLRRSAVPGKVPDTASIDFGEIALNTHDGLAYMKITGSFGERVVPIGILSGSFTGSLFGTASWAINAITASYALNAGSNISGPDYIVPIYSGSNALTGSTIFQSQSFTAINYDGSGPIDPTNPDVLFVNGVGIPTYNLISAHSNQNSYVQINVQNFNNSTEASSDIVATADNGTESENYIDMGINSSGFTNTGNVGGQNDAYLYSTGNDLYIGNASAGKQVIIFNGGLDAATQAKVWIHDQGTVGINTDTYNTTNPPSLQVNAPNDTTYNIAQFFGNTDNFAQVGIANANGGTTASTDLALYNNIDYENQLAGFVDLGINSTNYVYNGIYPGAAGDAYLFTDSEHLLLGAISASGNTKVTLFAGGVSESENAKLVLYGSNQHEMSGSLDISGSLTVRDGITGSLYGTASWALNSLTSSYSIGAVSSSYPIAVTGSTLYSTDPAAGVPYANGTIHSIRLGEESGYDSGDADHSIFLGYRSGYSASSAQFSVFLGESAGKDATYAEFSHFIGSVAGDGAVNASYSNFLGTSAGQYAINAGNSNFLGYYAGYSASNAYYSNFIGDNAGYQSSEANNSNFIGNNVGTLATNAFRSNFIGQEAGYAATNANNSNFFGYSTGKYASAANNSNFLGQYAGYQASNADNSNFLGQYAGYLAVDAHHSNFLGLYAGNSATTAFQSNFFGIQTGEQATEAARSNFFGTRAGGQAISASYSNLIGYQAGYSVGSRSIGSNNTIIGTNITLPKDAKDSINLGGLIFATGSYATTTGNPFSGSVNGRVGINQPNPVFGLDVSGSGRYTNGLQVTGSLLAPNITGSLFGTASWALNSVTSSNALTASYSINALSSSYALTASYALNVSGTISNAVSASLAQTASYALNAISASYAYTASSAVNSANAISASTAATASSADNFVVRQSITASSALINGTITAQTLVVQTVSSSVVYSSGSNVFGNSLTNTQVFTGSVSVTGSLNVNGSNVVLSNQTGSMSVLSSSFATSASLAQTASYVLNAVSSSFAATASNILGGSAGYVPYWSGSANLNNSIIYQTTSSNIIFNGTSDFGYKVDLNGSTKITPTPGTNLSIGASINTGSFQEGLAIVIDDRKLTIGSWDNSRFSVGTVYNHLNNTPGSDSIEFIAGSTTTTNGRIMFITASGNVGINTITPRVALDVSGSAIITGSLTVFQGITGSLFGTSSWAQNAITASYVLNAISSSFSTTAATASYANSGFDLGIAEFQTTSSITVAGTTIVSSINTGSFTSAFYNYTIASGSNARSGQVMSVWQGSTVRYTEVTTTDIGNTATASFAVTLSGAAVRLSFSAPGVWTVKSIANLL